MELERICRVNLWLTFRHDKETSAKEAASATSEPVANLSRRQKDQTIRSTRPKTLRKSKRSTELVEAMTQLRLEQKTWGKKKISRRLTQESFDASISTVGRIHYDLIARGAVQAYDHVTSGRRQRRKNKASNPQAIRLPKGFKPTILGESIQVETVHVDLPDGTKIYHIIAICPVSRVCYGDAFTSAGAKNASILLLNLLDYMPFKI